MCVREYRFHCGGIGSDHVQKIDVLLYLKCIERESEW